VLNFLDSLTIDNLTVFRDDLDPRRFYVLPDTPGIPVGEDGLPEFLFLVYLRDAADVTSDDQSGAGYLQFRTVLTLPQARHAALVTSLHTQLVSEQAAGKKPFGNAITITDPVLAAPLWTSGAVDLSTFAVGDTGLVRQATTAAPADLTSDLGASFTASLSADGAGVFAAAFHAYQTGAHQLPLVITYKLTYTGRVSATLRIDAAHSVIHEQVWKRAAPWQLLDTGLVRYVPLAITEPFRVDMLPALRARFGRVFPMILPADFGQAVQETIANNSISVQIEEASTGDPAADAATHASLLKLATDLLTDSLMPSLTTGTPVPGATNENRSTSNVSLMQLDENAAPGTSTFHLELNDAMTLERVAAPNAPLQVLIADPATLEACFQEVRLADDFFKEMKVIVSTSQVDFSAAGISRIHVYYRYHQTDDAAPAKPVVDRSDDGVLSTPADTLTFRFDTARTADGQHKTKYEYMAQVYWQKGGPPTVVPWTWSDSQRLDITPPVLGAVKVDAVMTAPPGSVDSARVELSYVAGDHTAYHGALELTPAAPRGSWFQATGEMLAPDHPPVQPRYTYRAIYRTGNAEIATPEQTSDQQTIEVPTPFAGAVIFTLMAQGSFDTMTSIAGTLTYADPAHGYTVVNTFVLTRAAPSWQVPISIMPGGPRTATYAARIEHADGTHQDLPPGTVTEGLNFAGADPQAAFSVQLRTDLLDFTSDIKAVHVTLRYTHADGTVTTAEPVFTGAAHDVFTWSVPRTAGDPAEYDAAITFYGQDRSKDLTLHLTHQTSTNVELDRSMPTS
jgi:hypothetical protein